MASKTNTIKTTLTLDGEREYTAALKASKQELKVMGSELKAATAEYQLAGDKMDYLRKRTDILNREIAEQEKIIRSTAEMYEKAAAGGDQYASRANRLKIQLNDAQAALYRMRREVQTADRELEELGRDSVSAGRDLERGITDGAEDAARELKRLAKESNDSIKDISMMGKVQMVGNMLGVEKDFATATYEWVESTKEYNIAVGKLKANTAVSGADWAAVEEEFLQVTALTGDAAATVTGLNALLTAGYTDAKVLDEMSGLLQGATIKFNDMSFEGLASSIQETLATGEAAGEFSDLIERMGGNVEDINKGLAAGQLEATDLYYLIAALDKDGELKKLLEEFYKGNEGVMGFAEAQTDLNHQLSILGGHIGDWISPAIKWIADYTAGINAAVEGEKDWLDATGILKNAGDIDPEAYAPYVHETWDPSLVTQMTPQEYAEMQKNFDVSDALDDVTDELEDYTTTIKQEGEQLGEQLGEGMESGLEPHLTSIQSMIDVTLRKLEQLPTTITPSTSSGGGAVQPAVIQIDGKKVGQALLPYTDSAQGKAWKATTYVG